MQNFSTFGYYPRVLDFTAGPITVSTLVGLEKAVAEVEQADTIHRDWIYSGSQLQRIFPLPKTHRIEHKTAESKAHVDFHVWVLSFFLGMRLTTTEAGFVDATPIEPGKLIDFVLFGNSIQNIPILAEDFWTQHRITPENTNRWVAAVHALYLAQSPQLLQFEQFIYLYTAIDACFVLAQSINLPEKRLPHAQRIDWLCKSLSMPTPKWATLRHDSNSKSDVADIRNLTLHEALFMNEPLGFATHSTGNLTLEMQALICRFLVALLGANDQSYITSPTDTRQPHGLRLS